MAAQRKYPWEDWFSRPSMLLKRGEHYHCSQSAMWQQVRNNAYARGVKFRLTDYNDSILITCEVVDEGAHTDKVGVDGQHDAPTLVQASKD